MSAMSLTRRLVDTSARMDQVLEGLKSPSPQILDGCAGLIELACDGLAGDWPGPPGSTREAASGDAAALAAATQLRAKIRRARRLLDNVHRFYERWGQLLGAQTGGYLPGGQAAPLQSGHRLYLRG